MTDSTFNEYASHLLPASSQGDSIDWEETTDAALMHLLRGKLSQGSLDQAAVPTLSFSLDNCENLKKHLSAVLERIESMCSTVSEEWHGQ
jgi:hypothetical protein